MFFGKYFDLWYNNTKGVFFTYETTSYYFIRAHRLDRLRRRGQYAAFASTVTRGASYHVSPYRHIKRWVSF